MPLMSFDWHTLRPNFYRRYKWAFRDDFDNFETPLVMEPSLEAFIRVCGEALRVSCIRTGLKNHHSDFSYLFRRQTIPYPRNPLLWRALCLPTWSTSATAADGQAYGARIVSRFVYIPHQHLHPDSLCQSIPFAPSSWSTSSAFVTAWPVYHKVRPRRMCLMLGFCNGMLRTTHGSLASLLAVLRYHAPLDFFWYFLT